MNNALGGQFGSRINMNLREDKGYTYGARSMFMALRAPGAFFAFAPVQTKVTKETLVELTKELRDIVGSKPLSAGELADSKNNLVKGFPQQFQGYGGIAGQLAAMVMYDLPANEWDQYVTKVNTVTSAGVSKAAKDHVHPEALLVVVVGDKEKIEPGIRELGLGEIHYADADGNVIK